MPNITVGHEPLTLEQEIVHLGGASHVSRWPADGSGFWRKFLIHDVVYWEPGGINPMGRATFPPPTLLKGRWDDKLLSGIGAETVVVNSSASVMLSQDVMKGGFLFFGSLEDAPEDPSQERECRIIEAVERNSDLKGRDTLFIARL